MLRLRREHVDAALGTEHDDGRLLDVPQDRAIVRLGGIRVGTRGRALPFLAALVGMRGAAAAVLLSAGKLLRQLVEQRQHELLLVHLAVHCLAGEAQRLGIEAALEAAQDVKHRRVGEVHEVHRPHCVQAEARFALEGGAAQQLEAEGRALFGAQHLEQAGIDLAEDAEHRRVAAELCELLGAQHAPHGHVREDDVLAAEHAVDARVLALDGHGDEVGEHRPARGAEAVEHLARLGGTRALALGAALEVAVHGAGTQRALVLAHLAHAREDRLGGGIRGLAHIGLVERDAEVEV